jgi:hypothetical protein
MEASGVPTTRNNVMEELIINKREHFALAG